MARMVLGAAGAIIGGIYGGPAGAQAGWMIGSTLGGLMTTTDRKVAIDEGGMQTTEEGAPLAVIFGTGVCTGNVHHAYQVRKIEETTRGKGGGETRAQSITYLRTYAIEICEGGIDAILIVKQGGQIVYDSRLDSVLSDEDNAAFLKRCTIYLGGEDQMPDPALEAIEGAGNVPAYRGTAYIVFADDDVTATGGSVPQYEFVVMQRGASYTFDTRVAPEGNTGTSGGGTIYYPSTWQVQHTVESTPRVYWANLRLADTTATTTGWAFVSVGGMRIRQVPFVTVAGQTTVVQLQVAGLKAGDLLTVGLQSAESGAPLSAWTMQVALYWLPAGYVPIHKPQRPEVLTADADGYGVLRYGADLKSFASATWGPGSYKVLNEPAGTTLDAIVADLHSRVGHTVDDYDVSELTDTVDGLTLASSGYTAADAINTLRTPYLFDRSEWGGKIRYPKRGKPVVAVLTMDDLVEEPDESERGDPVTYPRKLHLKYQSPAVNYEVTQVTSERISPDVRVVGESTIQVPVVLTPAEASVMVAKLHKVAQADAEAQVKVSVTDKWLGLVAADNVGLVLRGITRRLRIVQVDDADGVRALICSLDRQSATSANVTVIPPVPPTPPTGRYPGDTQLAVLDIAALTDDADAMGYVVATSGGRAAWRGALVQRSTDAGATYTEAVTTSRAGVLGHLLDPVPAASPWYTDTTNTVRVQLTRSSQELGSVSDLGFLQRGGGFALEAADGSWELLQYRDALDEGDGIYSLSVLHRGQLNSAATAHAAGAQFVLLDSVVPVSALSAWIGMDVTHRATSLGASPDGVPTQTHTYSGRQQQEWPVASLQSQVVAGTLTANWAPRHRFGTDLNPVASLYFRGYRVTVADAAAHTETFDTTDAALTRDASALVAPITVTVAALNAYTGAGPAASTTA